MLLPQVMAQDWSPTYELVGNGYCQDDNKEFYEGWYAVGWNLGALLFDDDEPSGCSCEECETLCNEHQRCVGYQYYCCPRGVRCFGGASVLFSYGTRPADAPPSPFSFVGPQGSETIGKRFKASGAISNVTKSSGASCFRKPSFAGPSEVV